jgi:ADP-heptose:LPS heptosyltransferase
MPSTPADNSAQQTNILVIKLGALGDFIQALGPMRAIRRHHPHAKITLLTTAPFEKMAQQCGYFNTIWIDEKPKLHNIFKWKNLQQKLNTAQFSRIYDLQNNDRSCWYFRLLANPKPEWVGIAKGASHRNTSPDRTKGHAYDGHVQTLGLAGINTITIDTLDWMQGDLTHYDIQNPYILLVPGCAPQHPHKRWPAQKYAEAAKILHQMGFQPVLIGTKDDKEATDLIAQQCPEALNLNGKTSLHQIAALAHNAAAAIGNDTGPMHLIAATGCPSLSLFSGKTNPVKHAPKGDNVTVLQENNLENLETGKVITNLQLRATSASNKSALH